MNAIKKTLLRSLGIPADHPWLVSLQVKKRQLLGVDVKLKNEYFKRNRRTRLHLGSSNHLMEGWLNTDLFPSAGVMTLDATIQYPFESNSFDLVFSEHMIEHVPHEAALKMLRECYRVLKPGGVIRVVTPDLAKILSVYPSPKDPQSDRYLKWMSSTFTPDAREDIEAHVINAFFRMWGHQFLYDQSTLTNTLTKCGFNKIEKHELGQSNCEDLRNLENVARYPDGLLNYESICLEACKG